LQIELRRAILLKIQSNYYVKLSFDLLLDFVKMAWEMNQSL